MIVGIPRKFNQIASIKIDIIKSNKAFTVGLIVNISQRYHNPNQKIAKDTILPI
ncbi:MAG: hypothetical protein LBU14_04280 [Candidatus Peribacteria bacterium]|nr:hypothetical protein [Candidatus Peribacteria bacterium]